MRGASVLVLGLAVAGGVPARGLAAEDEYIVVYESREAMARQVSAMLRAPRLEYGLIPGAVFSLDPEEAERLAADPDVAYVEPDGPVYALGEVIPTGVVTVGAPEVWTASEGGGVVVAVLDTGLDFDHPDLADWVDAKSFVYDNDPQDYNGHGTHTTGTVAAPINGLGVVGVAPQVSVLVGKVLSNQGSGSLSGVIAGIDWAVDNGAEVISMSLGSTTHFTALRDACDAAAEVAVVVAAAGNNGTGTLQYPAAYDSVLSVGAVDGQLELADFSDHGPGLDLVAPGVDVRSTVLVGNGIEAVAQWDGADHHANPLQGSAEGSLTAAVYWCGLGSGDDEANTCPDAVEDAIAHIRRGGDIPFRDKVDHALSKGAAGVIISNNVPGNFHGTLYNPYPVVVVSVSEADGDALYALPPDMATISVGPSDYERLSGTSMAAPHVAGAAALVLGACDATVDEVRAALEGSAFDLGDPGWDDFYGHGLVDVSAALAALGCDSDGDGVYDARDACPDTEAGVPVDDEGCSGAQIVARECVARAGAHPPGAYVRCVEEVSRRAVSDGLLTAAERGRIIARAAREGSLRP